MNIILYNSLTRNKEIFSPCIPKTLSLYVCGITPYDNPHIGHGRVYVSFDIFVRIFEFFSYSIHYVRNITDIDDKLILKAKELGDPEKYAAIAQQYITTFEHNMHQLNCQQPSYEPRVTQSIPDIISFIEKLIESGSAYVVNNDVYFDITTYSSYGKLSGKRLQDLRAGARIMVNDDKKNHGDFVLWKGVTNQPYWQSPWGNGRPGWHTECCVMAKKYLGETIDIHGGGQDLQFPHHENEIAQSESLHQKPFAHYWLHNAFVNIDKEKMSKSLGNMISLNAIFTQYDPSVLRFYFIQHHYRTPLDFSYNELDSAFVAYNKLANALQMIHNTLPNDQLYVQAIVHAITKNMLMALCDDANTPKCLGIIFENLMFIKHDPSLALITKSILQNIMGLPLNVISKNISQEDNSTIESLLQKRDLARKEKNWLLADSLRDELQKLGVVIQDEKVKKHE